MSNDSAVVVEGLGKKYFVAEAGDKEKFRKRSIRHLKEFFPYLRDENDYFWALKDVSFEVPRGRILGIMGRNGAGKSTLLKILTGVTLPSTGRAVLNGKVGSLLEVGTGFHPDLSGRDNVFMSGALLGLSRIEIRAKFDEVVAFAGIERFIDVPVKRYSSGMYVRLAFAVASMLRSDILIVDEVLAVGDAAFQDKARANMQEEVKSGRTILFVTHNARAATELCHDGVILEKGRVICRDGILPAVRKYLHCIQHLDEVAERQQAFVDLRNATRWEHASTDVLTHIRLENEEGNPCTYFQTGKQMRVIIGYANMHHSFPAFELVIINEFGERVTTISSTHTGEHLDIPACGEVLCVVEDLRLGEGSYVLALDYGTCTGESMTYRSHDAVTATHFRVSVDGFVKGLGVNSAQGAVHKSHWRALTKAPA